MYNPIDDARNRINSGVEQAKESAKNYAQEKLIPKSLMKAHNTGKYLKEKANMLKANSLRNRIERQKAELKAAAKRKAKKKLLNAASLLKKLLLKFLASDAGKILIVVVFIMILVSMVTSYSDSKEKEDIQMGNISTRSDDDATTTRNKEGIKVPDSFTFSNKILYTYYQYWSEKSLYVYYDDADTEIFGTDGKMLSPIQYGSAEHMALSNKFKSVYGEDLLDKYEREHYFMLSAESLYVLDHYLNDDEFVWPQQFIQPVAYDLDKFVLKDLASGSTVKVKSIKYVWDAEKESYGKLKEDGTLDFSFTQYASEDAVGTIGKTEKKDNKVNVDTTNFDYIAYLSCKYESGGNPGQAGGDGGNACGKFQFDNRYVLGPFIDWCLENKNSSGIYDKFQPYTGLKADGNIKSKLKSNEFFQVWQSIYKAHPTEFEQAQDEYAKLTFYDPVVKAIKDRWSIDIDSKGPGVKGAIFSLANRCGPYADSVAFAIEGLTNNSSDEEIINQIYDKVSAKFPGQKNRCNAERNDALGINNGTLDIYEASGNSYGKIDWSYKKDGDSSVPATGITTNKDTMCWPVDPSYPITSYFGLREIPTPGATADHGAVDIGCPTGTSVWAAQSGTVTISGPSESAGNWVVIDHGNGFITKYMHNSQLLVSVGDTVSKGQEIAISGNTGYSTGPHCHFQIEKDGIKMDPLTFKYDNPHAECNGNNTITGDGSIGGSSGGGSWVNKDRQEGYITTSGIWDYGFGSILKYEKFHETAEHRGKLTHIRLWDNEKEIVEADGSVSYGGWTDELYTEEEAKSKAKEDKDRYSYKSDLFDDKYQETVPDADKDVFVIGDVIVPAGTIKNVIVSEMQQTDETFGPNGSQYSSEYEKDARSGDILSASEAKRVAYAKTALKGKDLSCKFTYEEETITTNETDANGNLVEKTKTILKNIKFTQIQVYNVKKDKFEWIDLDNETDLKNSSKLKELLAKTDSVGIPLYDTYLFETTEIEELKESGFFHPIDSLGNALSDVKTGTASKSEPMLMHQSEIEVPEEERTQRFYATGYVWLQVPKYVEVPNMDGLTGAEYYYDYFNNYDTYAPYQEVNQKILTDKIEQNIRIEEEYPELYEILKTEKFDPDEMAKLTANNGDEDSGTSSEPGAITDGTTIEIPSGLGIVHTYMGWQCITAPDSTQYKLREQAGMNFDDEGFGVINGRYVIACTTTYGNVGDYIDFYQEDGSIIKCIIGDIKSQGDAGCNKWGHQNGTCIVEFVVDKASWYSPPHTNPGNEGCHPEWHQNITKAVNGGSWFDNPDFGSGSSTSSSSKPSNSSSGSSLTSKDTNNTFAKYEFSEAQIKALATVCQAEQGSAKGAAAEASLMANLFEIKGSSYGSGGSGLYNYVKTGGWFANASSYMDSFSANGEALKDDVLNAVKSVLIDGKRTIPGYIDEHDDVGNIDSVTNNGTEINKNNASEYIQYKSLIHQSSSVGGGEWTYYCHPDVGSDPFGYTSEEYRSKVGELYYDFDTGLPVNGDEDMLGEQDNIYTLFDWATYNWTDLHDNIRNIFPVLKYFTYGADSSSNGWNGTMSELQQKVVEVAKTNNNGTLATPSGYCAMWVETAYKAAGAYSDKNAFGNAIDYWTQWKDSGSTSTENIPPGAAVIGSGSNSAAGNTYGHVGIYLGDGMVADNIGSHRVCTLEEWYTQQTGHCGGTPGFIGWVWPWGEDLSDGSTTTSSSDLSISEAFDNSEAELKIHHKDRLGVSVDETNVLYRMLSMADGLNVEEYETLNDMFFIEHYTDLFRVSAGKQFSSGVNLGVYFGEGDDVDSSKIEFDYPLKNAKLKTPYKEYLGVVEKTGYIDVITVPGDTVIAPADGGKITSITKSIKLNDLEESVSIVDVRYNDSTYIEFTGIPYSQLNVKIGDEVKKGDTLGTLSNSPDAYLRVMLHHGQRVDDPSWLFGLQKDGDDDGDVAIGEAAGIEGEDARIEWLYDGNGVPTTKEENEKYLEDFEVEYLDANGNLQTMTITMHKKLKTEVQAIFKEMVNAGFKVIGGNISLRTWGSDVGYKGKFYQSAHAYGHAFDVNPDQNYYISSSGATVGSHYSPGSDPYSVTPEIVEIWKKHGFYWGGDWTDPKDYMHFSYFNH